MINEVLFGELAVFVVTDDHPLVSVGDTTLVTDIWACQCVVSSDHHHADLSLLQLPDRSLRLRLQLVLKHLETIEDEASLGHLTSDGLVVIALNSFAAYGEHSETVGSVLFQHLIVVVGNWGLLHNGSHHLGWALGVCNESSTFFGSDFHNHTHSL